MSVCSGLEVLGNANCDLIMGSLGVANNIKVMVMVTLYFKRS